MKYFQNISRQKYFRNISRVYHPSKNIFKIFWKYFIGRNISRFKSNTFDLKREILFVLFTRWKKRRGAIVHLFVFPMICEKLGRMCLYFDTANGLPKRNLALVVMRNISNYFLKIEYKSFHGYTVKYFQNILEIFLTKYFENISSCSRALKQ